MTFASNNTRFPNKVSVEDSTAANSFAIGVGTTVGLGTLVAGQIAYDTTLAKHVSRQTNSAGTAATKPCLPIASGVITIAAGSTTGTATIPAGVSITSNVIITSLGGSATTVVATSAILATVSGTTLTVTIVDPGGATTAYVSYVIY